MNALQRKIARDFYLEHDLGQDWTLHPIEKFEMWCEGFLAAGFADKETEKKKTFELCWQVYPRKEGKHEAWLRFRSQVKDDREAQALMAAIRRYAEHCRKSGTEKEFIMMGKVFFNHRWRDWVSENPRAETPKTTAPSSLRSELEKL